MIIENSSIDTTNLSDRIACYGDRAYAEFRRCGNLYVNTESWSNFPDQQEGHSQFTPEEKQAVLRMAASSETFANTVKDMQRIRNGEFRATLPVSA